MFLIWKRFKAWAFRKPVTGPSYPPKTLWDVAEFHVRHPFGKDFTVTKEMLEDAKINLVEYHQQRAAKQLDLILRSQHINTTFEHRGSSTSGMSVPSMVAVGIATGIF